MAEDTQSFVIDASVAAKWFLPERDTQKALALRDGHLSGRLTLYAPALAIYEVANALRYRPDLVEADLEKDIEALMSFDLAFVVPSSKSVARATLMARKLGITVYDAVYLELADDIGCQLVTADEELAEKARGTARVSLL